jgi:hypothetical protein
VIAGTNTRVPKGSECASFLEKDILSSFTVPVSRILKSNITMASVIAPMGRER